MANAKYPSGKPGKNGKRLHGAEALPPLPDERDTMTDHVPDELSLTAPAQAGTAPWPGAVDSPAAFAGSTYAAPPAETRSPVQLILRSFKFRATILLPALIIPMIALPLVWKFLQPTYKARGVVRVSPVISPLVYQTDNNGQVPLYNAYLNTQVGMILSPTVLGRVVDPQRHPDVVATHWYKQGEQLNAWGEPVDPVNRLLKGLSVKPRSKTELIDVAFTTANPKEAKLIANTLIGEYEIYHRDNSAQNGQLAFEALTKELNTLKRELDAELNLRAAVSKELGTSEPEELRAQLTVRLNDLEQNWKALKREQEVARWELETLKNSQHPAGDGEEVPAADIGPQPATGDTPASTAEAGDAPNPEETRFAMDREWLALRRALESSELQLDIAKDRYGDAHPKLRDLTANVELARSRLNEREDQLRDIMAGEQNVSDTVLASADPKVDPAKVLAYKNERTKVQANLLQRDIEEQRQEVRRAGELAEELQRRQEEINRKRELYEHIQTRINQLDMESKNPLGRISTQPAITPDDPNEDRRMLLSVAVVLGGMGIGFGLALLRSSTDKSMHMAEDVMATAMIPFLGQLPHCRREPWRDVDNEQLHESLRMVRTSLLERVLNGNNTGSTVLITSPTAQAGKTTLTILLGESLAALGKKVLLIDADMRRCSLTERLQAQAGEGLSAILNGQAEWKNIVCDVPEFGVHMIAAGKRIGGNDAEKLGAPAFAAFLNECRQHFDYVLLDSPPVLPVADARMLARQVDGCILALRASQSRRVDATNTLAMLSTAGARLLGTVLVGVRPQPGYYGSYGYGYGYGYGYASGYGDQEGGTGQTDKSKLIESAV